MVNPTMRKHNREFIHKAHAMQIKVDLTVLFVTVSLNRRTKLYVIVYFVDIVGI